MALSKLGLDLKGLGWSHLEKAMGRERNMCSRKRLSPKKHCGDAFA